MMSFKQLEADFQRKLNQYKSIYQDYLVELKHQEGAYWNTEENVTVANRATSAQLPFITKPDISKQECLHACSSDPKCKYVLFSDSGNGECAANQCLKWTQDAKGIIASKSKPKFFNIFVGNSNNPSKTVTLPETGITVYPVPNFKVSVTGTELTVTKKDSKKGWSTMLQLQGVKDPAGVTSYVISVGTSTTNPKEVSLPETGLTVSAQPINGSLDDAKFATTVSGKKLTVTRTDKNSGWSTDLQLRAARGKTEGFLMDNKGCAPGQGPAQTHYVYSGWTKPEWKDMPNISLMGAQMPPDSKNWKEFGTGKNLVACKDMSATSAEGPFSSVVFVESTNKCYGGVPGVHNQNVKMEGVYSSIPPSGSTGTGGQQAEIYILQLKTLNNELKQDLYKMGKALDKMEAADANDKKVHAQTRENIKTDHAKLGMDRVALDNLSNEISNLDVKLGMLNKIETQEKMIYTVSVLALILFIGFMIRKSS
jgi:hypothetical protein